MIHTRYSGKILIIGSIERQISFEGDRRTLIVVEINPADSAERQSMSRVVSKRFEVIMSFRVAPLISRVQNVRPLKVEFHTSDPRQRTDTDSGKEKKKKENADEGLGNRQGEKARSLDVGEENA